MIITSNLCRNRRFDHLPHHSTPRQHSLALLLSHKAAERTSNEDGLTGKSRRRDKYQAIAVEMLILLCFLLLTALSHAFRWPGQAKCRQFGVSMQDNDYSKLVDGVRRTTPPGSIVVIKYGGNYRFIHLLAHSLTHSLTH